MAKLQKWTTEIDGETHSVAFKRPCLFCKARITIDEFTFPLETVKPFSSHREIFRLGDRQAILEVTKSGKAKIILDGEELEETK